MKEYKCECCKELIKIGDIATLIPKKDRKGNIKYLADGVNPQTHKYHDYCYELKEKENKEWNDLCKYVKDKYFNVVLPNRMFTGLRELKINSNIIKGCFESIENNLLPYVQKKTFDNDNQKAGYILAALKGNINTYNENYQRKIIEDKVKQESKVEIINTAKEVTTEFKAPKSKNKFTFDFMD